jgi:hypothetical protein
MQRTFAFTLIAAGFLLAACETAAPPMAGTAAGTAPDTTIGAAARERAGGGCPPTTAGMPQVVTRGDGPHVLRTTPGAGTAGAQVAQAIPPGGTADSCP